MPKIKVLPANIANKIAAGEVVERPAAVVKELIENSIDAAASQITVIIEDAGKELIQIIDNGIGMAEDDALLAFERHATSKIADVNDLERILTLGFRGEALPSIASVSRMELKTRPEEAPAGVALQIKGGVLEASQKVALKRGSIISVKNLFFNTPARRNFLRSNTTEFNHILKCMKRFFLAYPEIHFILIHNGEELYDLPAADLAERIAQVFGQRFLDRMVYIQESLGEIVLEGYAGRPDHTRGNSENQFIYLNRRTIVNRTLSHAVFQAYGNLIDRFRYPQFMMYLQIAPNLVDVNVHPTKMEVRFANERVIYQLFMSTVRKAVQSQNIIPSMNPKMEAVEKKEIQEHFCNLSKAQNSNFKSVITNLGGDVAKSFEKDALSSEETEQTTQMTFSYDTLPEKKSSDKGEEAPEIDSENDGYHPQSKLWQVHKRYIFSQIKSGLAIIDQHVAHERILFEQILDQLNKSQLIPSQQLLFPQTMELALEDYLIYSDIKEWLAKVGFLINELSGRTIVIEAIPADVKVGKEAGILLEMIDYYRANEGGQYEPHEKIAAAFSCKNAIKSGEKLTLEEMNALVDQLFRTREPYFCPHGRPVVITLDLEEFDRKFKRI